MCQVVSFLLLLVFCLYFLRLIILCFSVGILGVLTWSMSSYFTFIFMLFIKFSKFQPLFLQIFSLLLLGQLQCVGHFDGVLQVPWALFNFIHSFFCLFLRLIHFHCPVFKFSDSLSSACSHLLLNSSSELFIAVIIFLAPEFHSGFFLGFLSLY